MDRARVVGVISPPIVTEGSVVVTSGDGRIFGLAATDGKTRWVNQRINPPLTVRNSAGGVASRGGVFIGVAGGRLLALDAETGTIGWDAAVATPKGATELERIADVTSRPWIEERQACAVAYQGRLACFEILRGTPTWTRDVSSLSGISGDDALYLRDRRCRRGARTRPGTGASLWKQDKLAARRPVAGNSPASFSPWSTSRATSTSSRPRPATTSDVSRPTARHRRTSPSRRTNASCGSRQRGRCTHCPPADPPAARLPAAVRGGREPMLPTIALVGRPNVGKSTLFNRLTRTRDALVADFPGLTRDRHYGRGQMGERPFFVIDTGGFEPVAKGGILKEMARQTGPPIAECRRRRVHRRRAAPG